MFFIIAFNLWDASILFSYTFSVVDATNAVRQGSLHAREAVQTPLFAPCALMRVSARQISDAASSMIS